MNSKKKIEIYTYLKRYIEQKEEHEEYIDYYELFDLDRNMSLEKLNKKLRKIKKLIHPDQVEFIESSFTPTFIEVTEEVLNMTNIFSRTDLKSQYDQSLDKMKEKPKSKEYSQVEITKSDEDKLERVVETMIYKNGFYPSFRTLGVISSTDYYINVTRENKARSLAQELGKEKIALIIKNKRKDIMEENPNNMLMDYYLQVMNNPGIKAQADIFYNACFITSKKYDKSETSQQLPRAIDLYMVKNSAEGFTNSLNSRDCFEKSNLNSNDIFILMLAKIHSKREENFEYSYSNMIKKSPNEQIDTFTKIIRQEVIASQNNRKNTI